MKTKGYVVAIPKSLSLTDLLNGKPELYTYTDDFDPSSEDVIGEENQTGYTYLENILQELKQNIEIDMVGDFKRIAILYYIIDYAEENNQLLGEIRIPGKEEKIINVEAGDIKDSTRHRILQQGLLDSIVKTLKH